MNVINKLVKTNLLLNKKRSAATIIGILLSVSLICAVAMMGWNLRGSVIDSTKESQGSYHLAINHLDKKQSEVYQANVDFHSTTIQEIGFASVDSQNEYKPYVYLLSVDSKFDFGSISAQILEGRRPVNEHEIVISESLLSNGGVDLKINDQVTFDIGTRSVNQVQYSYEEGESLKDTTPYTFKVVGIVSRSSYGVENYECPGYSIYTTGLSSNSSTVLLTLNNLLGYQDKISNLLEVDNYKMDVDSDYLDQKAVSLNHELLRWQVFSFSDSTLVMLINLFLFVISIIIFVSVYCIKNAFEISASEKLKLFSMLKSVGATKKQIRQMIYKEGFYLARIAIPLGVLAGLFASYVLVHVVDYIVGDSIGVSTGIQFSFSWAIVVLSALLGVVTVYFSCLKSVRMVSRLTPIENIRNSNQIKIKAKKLRVPKYIKRYFGMGGVLAYKNLKRSKKKYRTTVISLIVSIFAFVSMSSFIGYMKDLVNSQYGTINANIAVVSYAGTQGEELVQRSDLQSVQDIDHLMEIVNYGLSPDREYVIYSMDDESFLEYKKENNIDRNAQSVLIDYLEVYDEDKRIMERKRVTDYEVGDTVPLSNSFHVSIDAFSPVDFTGSTYSYETRLLVSSSIAKQSGLTAKTNSFFIKTDKVMQVEETLEEKYDISNVAVFNLEEQQQSNNAMLLLYSIFLYGFIIVITLIGVTNIFTTISSNIMLRASDFATLKSVGMTQKEFSKMIHLETMFFCVKSLVIGLVLGFGANLVILRILLSKSYVELHVPWAVMSVCVLFVFCLVYSIMNYSSKKINKQNIMEVIREVNK